MAIKSASGLEPQPNEPRANMYLANIGEALYLISRPMPTCKIMTIECRNMHLLKFQKRDCLESETITQSPSMQLRH